MKKIFIVFALAAACYACGGGSSESSTPVSNNETNQNSQIGGESSTTGGTQTPSSDKASAPAGDSAQNQVAAAATGGGNGKALIEASDCRTCHQDNAKVIGPAYTEVAKKYPNTPENVKMLAGKVIAGGKGNWGEIPMTAHPNVSQADAEEMVRYILSMKQ